METYNPGNIEKPDTEEFRNLEGRLKSIKINNAVYWIAAPAAGLYILCGCPEDSLKHMIRIA